MPFADELIGEQTTGQLIAAIAAAAPGNRLPNLRAAAKGMAGLSLRERSDRLRDGLLADLPGDYAGLARTVRAAAAGPLPFGGWLIWPVTSAVAARAVTDGTGTAFDDALALLAELTGRLTSEFAIRVLLDHDLGRALPIVLEWTRSPDEHVRRLASEGTRAYLPWAKRVPALLAAPEATVPILTALYRDDSEYVRRSVANHLNDLSREHPDLVVATAKAWLASPDATTAKVVRHALRTLVKKGHPGALALLGFAPASVTVDGPLLAGAEIPYGGEVAFTATVVNTGDAAATLAIDYVVHHQKANGKQTTKTFKLTTATLAPGDRLELSRRHSFRAITTRRYYPGAHAVELQLNGVRSGRADFELLPPQRAGADS
ncbi:DNA alkylation repair protein [Actinoplanes friuliensis]|uniref:DNA alkylation repair protein n=1 Tax=Actinoplanes friuliensis DSM 7358 TaxID=1246995 RepID=U5VZ21_9ACTN|nr:DNA alkylation repair protein [Actinoplanes friuliensis]AGZ42027.1 DNA alkylation repair protein [Actinoplanes friuliensis DSM 7358]